MYPQIIDPTTKEGTRDDGQSTFSNQLVTPSFQLVFVATAVENRRKTIIVITKAFVSFSMSLLLCHSADAKIFV